MTLNLLDLPDELLILIISEIWRPYDTKLLHPIMQTNQRLRELTIPVTFNQLHSSLSPLHYSHISLNRNVLESVNKICLSSTFINTETVASCLLLSLVPRLKKLEIYEERLENPVSNIDSIPKAFSNILSTLKVLQYLDLSGATGFEDKNFKITTLLFPQLLFLVLPNRFSFTPDPRGPACTLAFSAPLSVRDITIFTGDLAGTILLATVLDEKTHCVTFDGPGPGLIAAIKSLPRSVFQLKFCHTESFVFGIESIERTEFWDSIISARFRELSFDSIIEIGLNDPLTLKIPDVTILSLSWNGTFTDKLTLDALHTFILSFPNLITLAIYVDLLPDGEDDSLFFRLPPAYFIIERPFVHGLLSLIKMTSVTNFIINGRNCDINYFREGTKDDFTGDLTSMYSA